MLTLKIDTFLDHFGETRGRKLNEKFVDLSNSII